MQHLSQPLFSKDLCDYTSLLDLAVLAVALTHQLHSPNRRKNTRYMKSIPELGT